MKTFNNFFKELKTKFIYNNIDLNKDVSIVVLSTDQYEPVWYPFFSLLDKHWPNHPKTYLLTETKNCKYSDFTLNMNITDINKWTLRIKKCLHLIPNEYVIMMDGDYLLRQDVNDEIIRKCVCYMKNNKNIVNFNYESNTFKEFCYQQSDYKGFLRKMPNAPAMCSCQASLWNKQHLINALDITDCNPWSWETNCQFNDFSGYFKREDLEYYIRYDIETPFKYENSGCIHGGKWYFDDIVYLFNEEKCILDNTNLKTMDISTDGIPFDILWHDIMMCGDYFIDKQKYKTQEEL